MKEYGIDQSLPFVTCCCVCRRIKRGGDWFDNIQIFHEAVNLSHGYCPECVIKVTAEMKQYHKEKTP